MSGLIQLGDPNAIACVGDSCAIPAPSDAAPASPDAAPAAPDVKA
ncbi:hypothetical protein [Salinibacterium sp. ZJ454]|nr:hypothetical protein [Salinibacterium sp. ZJ454]